MNAPEFLFWAWWTILIGSIAWLAVSIATRKGHTPPSAANEDRRDIRWEREYVPDIRIMNSWHKGWFTHSCVQRWLPKKGKEW